MVTYGNRPSCAKSGGDHDGLHTPSGPCSSVEQASAKHPPATSSSATSTRLSISHNPKSTKSGIKRKSGNEPAGKGVNRHVKKARGRSRNTPDPESDTFEIENFILALKEKKDALKKRNARPIKDLLATGTGGTDVIADDLSVGIGACLSWEDRLRRVFAAIYEYSCFCKLKKRMLSPSVTSYSKGRHPTQPDLFIRAICFVRGWIKAIETHGVGLWFVFAPFISFKMAKVSSEQMRGILEQLPWVSTLAEAKFEEVKEALASYELFLAWRQQALAPFQITLPPIHVYHLGQTSAQLPHHDLGLMAATPRAQGFGLTTPPSPITAREFAQQSHDECGKTALIVPVQGFEYGNTVFYPQNDSEMTEVTTPVFGFEYGDTVFYPGAQNYSGMTGVTTPVFGFEYGDTVFYPGAQNYSEMTGLVTPVFGVEYGNTVIDPGPQASTQQQADLGTMNMASQIHELDDAIGGDATCAPEPSSGTVPGSLSSVPTQCGPTRAVGGSLVLTESRNPPTTFVPETYTAAHIPYKNHSNIRQPLSAQWHLHSTHIPHNQHNFGQQPAITMDHTGRHIARMFVRTAVV